tara:strand:- start:1180 stop:1482 length:303 start_codon:yes stop_codon:yes gene_type:complete
MKWNNEEYKKPTFYTEEELSILEKELRVYVKDSYTKTLTDDPIAVDKIIQGWITFYAKEEFSLDEALLQIEDYTSVNTIAEDLDNTELSERVELRSIRGH